MPEFNDTTTADSTTAPPPEPTDKRNEPDAARRANVSKMLREVKSWKAHWADDFKRMRDDMKFAEGQHWDNPMPGMVDDRLIVDITTRHIQLRTSALYAKNPTILARRRDTIDFAFWTEDPNELVMAQQRIAVAGQGPNNEAAQLAVANDVALLADVKEGMERRQMLDKLGRTLEVVTKYQVEHTQYPPFKTQVKDLIPRTLTCGVGYVKLDYQRKVGRKPADETRLADMRDRVAKLSASLEAANDKEGTAYEKERAEMDDLRSQMTAMQNEKQIILKEGLLFQFPESTAIIPDKKCRALPGFVGCDRVAEEFLMTPEDVKETYNVDLGKRYTKYFAAGNGEALNNSSNRYQDDTDGMCCVYVVFDRRRELVYVVCDGYDDFLVEPAPPEIVIPQFWPWFALVFNRRASQKSPFPKSDVSLLRPMQMELNRNMEALRQHRIASQPKYLGDASAFEDSEILNIMDKPNHEVIMVKAIAEGKKVADMIQLLPKDKLDPAVFSTDVIYECVMRVLGSQEANFGGTSKGDTTATESSIAESSRLSSQNSNADDLDDLLSLLFRSAGVVLMMEMDAETAKKIAGRGAVWVQLTRGDAVDQLYLEVQAGSSGRPNQAQDIAAAEKVLPFLLQIPGMSPAKVADWLIRTMDSRLRPSDLMDAAITQSIVAMNRGPVGSVAGGATPPDKDPAQQGAEGANNAPNDDQSQGAPEAQPMVQAA